MSRRKIGTGIVALVMLFLFSALWHRSFSPSIYKQRCIAAEGKWINESEFCVNKDCAKTHSCVGSYASNPICRKLKVGIDTDTLYFELGMPVKQIDNQFIFDGGGGDPGPVATVMHGHVVSLKCGSTGIR